MVVTALRLASDGDGELHFVDDQHGSPTFTADLGPAIVTLGLDRRPGIFHVTNGGATTYLSKLYAGDDYYTDTDSNAYDLPTFLGNHDMGRVGAFVNGSQARDQFAHAVAQGRHSWTRTPFRGFELFAGEDWMSLGKLAKIQSGEELFSQRDEAVGKGGFSAKAKCAFGPASYPWHFLNDFS